MDSRAERTRGLPDNAAPARPQFGRMRHGPVGKPANENRRPVLLRLLLGGLVLFGLIAAAIAALD